MPVITGVAHVCFTVADLDRAVVFYCDRLGFRHGFDFRRDDGQRFGVYLHVGARNFIELFEGELPDGHAPASFRHVCFEVDDLAATVRALRGRAVEVSDPELGKDHSYQAWLSDPDGNRIELHEYTPESWQAPLLPQPDPTQG